MSQKKISIARMPIVTAVIVALSMVIHCIPNLSTLLIYDRVAIMSGELWRVPTSLLVHYSVSNLFWNLLVLAVFGILLEPGNRLIFLSLFVLSAASNTLFLFNSEIEFFAGLSGFIIALVAYFCIIKITTTESKNFWIIVFSLLIGKIGYEYAFGKTIFVDGDFYVLPEAHLLGLVCAVMLFFVLPKLSRSF